MLEILTDLAPGAELLFATAFGGQARFASNIEALRAAGADVIVDDVFYFAEGVFQDGTVARAVQNVVADGAMYFSSAGNSGNFNDGTAGVWEGQFVPASPPPVLESTLVHDFGGSNSNLITKDPPFLVTLQWADPLGGSFNDYDLYLLSEDLQTVIDSSTNVQNGSQDPYEAISSSGYVDLGNRLVIVLSAGEPRYLHLNTHRGELAIATDGQVAGHAAAAEAFAVAAVDAASAGSGGFTGGAANPVEPFSSDGPRRVFFDRDGNAITPGDFSAGGGELRQKPDLAAADGVSTSTPGFSTFFGTSAAAPHAAAIAALLLDANPDLTPGQLRNHLQNTALDIEAAGVDRDSGHGVIDALAAVGTSIPEMTSPLPETTLAGSTQTFWWAHNGLAVAEWWLYVGTSLGERDLLDSGTLGEQTELSVTDLPTSSETLFIRLWYRITNEWKYVDFRYQAAELQPKMTAPAPGTSLGGAEATFQWSADGAAVAEWWIYVGTTEGGRELFDSGSLGLQTSATVGSLPLDGSDLYVRLWYRGMNRWQFIDVQYTAAAIAPRLTSPAAGSSLPGTSASFTWTQNETAVEEWWLYLGSRQGWFDLFDSGSLALATGVTVNDLPSDGSPVHVRLWYRVQTAWLWADYELVAHQQRPIMTSPVEGAVLEGAAQTFSWAANQTPVSAWWLYIGSTLGERDLLDSGLLGAATSLHVDDLPTDGRALFVRLWFLTQGAWQFEDFDYTADSATTSAPH